MNQIPNIEEEFNNRFGSFWSKQLGGNVIYGGELEQKFGTWATVDKDAIIDFIHHQLQKARQDWLRQEIVRLEAMKEVYSEEVHYSGGHDEYEVVVYNQALETIIDRYHSELDQETSPVYDFFTAPEEVKRPVYERALQKAQEEQEKMLNQEVNK